MGTDFEYIDYWEKCWNGEDEDAIYHWFEGWNKSASEEMTVFKEFGVKSVCDAACGFGAHTLAFASNGFDVSAFDVAPKAVEYTANGLKKFGYENVEVKEASITETGYTDETFDAVTAYAVLDHLTEKDAKSALAELFRITKPCGLVLVSFDTAQEDDLLSPHEDLPDGSMLYTEDEALEGMIFRPYDEERIASFVHGLNVIRKWTNRKGDQIVILQK